MKRLVRRELLVEELGGGIIDRGLESILGGRATSKTEKRAIIRDYGRYHDCTVQVCYSLTDDSKATFWISGEESATLRVADEIRRIEIYRQSPEAIIFKEEIVNKYLK